MPALIAVGQAVHHHRPSCNPLARWLRSAVAERTLAKLRHIQPESGGFLEAAPLTSFVMMALVSIGQGDHPSVAAGGEFLARTVRPDGSWPIDTDLSTWVTTLSINALAAGGDVPGDGGDLARWLNVEERIRLLRTLLSRQLKVRHPYTDAAPGGWAWTDLSGGVPDADDTAGALLVLLEAALGFAISGGMFLFVYLISRRGLGGGDVKFMAAAGLYLGFSGVLPVIFCGALLAGVTALALMLFKRLGSKDTMPLAPFLYLGILITLFFL